MLPVFFLTLFSCEEFLTEEPIGVVSPSVFFKSESDFDFAVKGTYAALGARELYGWHVPVTQVGLTYELTTAASRPEYLLSFDATYATISYFWMGYYRLINQCNTILSQIDDADINDAIRDELKGEALFLRALAYFDLTRLYGGVPLHITPTLSLDDTAKPRATIAECYAQIIGDLMNAEALLLVENSFSVGRSKKISAAGLLAKVYLTMAGKPLEDTSKLPLAHAKLLEIVNPANPAVANAPYTNALEADYQSLFTQGTKNDGVTVLANENGVESIFEINFTSIGDGTEGNVFCNTGWIFNTKKATTWLWNLFDINDYRRSVSYKSNKSQLKWPKTTAIFNDHESNWHYLRYADLVLMLAEVENELNGPSDLGLLAINAIRARARAADGTPRTEPADYSVVEATSKEVFRDLIYNERRIELSAEGVTWFDWQRTGKIEEMVDLQGAANRNYLERIELFPIPYQEFTLAGGLLTQNPGYE